tara:strand:- start:518 stop:1060 length:543 start_codon:yes stop_codon:yes gene_type:complete
MIQKRRGIYVTDRHAVPMMGVCKNIGKGYDLDEIKKLYPVNDDDIIDCIQFFCKYTEFDPFHILTFKNLSFSECCIELKIQEISAECYMRMLNRSIYMNKRLKNFDAMLLEGITISLRNACELITGRIDETESLNPILDKAFANEIEMFLEMTKRNVTDNMNLLDLDHFENNEIILLDSD